MYEHVDVSRCTPGPTHIVRADANCMEVRTKKHITVCKVFEPGSLETRDYENAALISEAFNVASETGMGPQQLTEERDELLKAFELAHAFLDSLPQGWLGNTTGDVGALNDFYVASSKIQARVTGQKGE